MLSANRNPSVRELHRFGLAMLGGFTSLAVLFWYAGLPRSGWMPTTWIWIGSGRQAAAVVFLAVGVGMLACSRLPATGKALYVVWMSAAMKIGGVVTLILLTVLYVLLLPVFSLIRLGDPLRMRRKKDGSYWEEHPAHEPTIDRMARPF